MVDQPEGSSDTGSEFVPAFSGAWLRWRDRVDLAEYNSRWDRLAAQGASVHDEADLIDHLGGRVVLDAGCGTGRVAAELSRRGRRVVGLDNDPDMLAMASAKPEPVRWQLGDLATFEIPDRFDIAVLAGDVLPFVRSESRAIAVANVGRHLNRGGLLVIGSSAEPGCGFDDVDRWCVAAGMDLERQYSTWDRSPFDGGGYRVSVHRKQGSADR